MEFAALNGRLRSCMTLGLYTCLSRNGTATENAGDKMANGDASTQTLAMEHGDALALAMESHHHDVVAWLKQSVEWTTPLHYLAVISPQLAKQLLRDGADIYATIAPGTPSPVSIAHDMLAKGQAPRGSAAWLVLCAAEPWSRATHELFPTETRRRVFELNLIGSLLARQHSKTSQGALLDIWADVVLPHALSRGGNGFTAR